MTCIKGNWRKKLIFECLVLTKWVFSLFPSYLKNQSTKIHDFGTKLLLFNPSIHPKYFSEFTLMVKIGHFTN